MGSICQVFFPFPPKFLTKSPSRNFRAASARLLGRAPVLHAPAGGAAPAHPAFAHRRSRVEGGRTTSEVAPTEWTPSPGLTAELAHLAVPGLEAARPPGRARIQALLAVALAWPRPSRGPCARRFASPPCLDHCPVVAAAYWSPTSPPRRSAATSSSAAVPPHPTPSARFRGAGVSRT